uniref:hypothetical protein n=1 Tax=Chitinimonas sp. TaxID=1934313 RepID=UPI0035B1D2EA
MTPSDYLDRAGLAAPLEQMANFVADYRRVLQTAALPADIASLYQYRVPELGDNGACSLPDLLADAPYDLAATLGGVQEATTARLAALHALVQAVARDTGCGWLGIYQARELAGGPALVKLAYTGKPSRAEFPLTAEFAAHSNNSTVGLSGKARLIASVDAYLAEGGAYYTCDAAVQSEACLPL